MAASEIAILVFSALSFVSVTLFPNKKILPDLGSSIKLIILSKLVLPEPEDPIIAIFWELDKTKSKLLRTLILFFP